MEHQAELQHTHKHKTNTKSINHDFQTRIRPAHANQRSFDITWQEVQNAFVAAFKITGFWYILSRMSNEWSIKMQKQLKAQRAAEKLVWCSHDIIESLLAGV